MKNKQEYIDLCKKYNLPSEPTSEVLRLGTVYTDPTYYKKYRLMSMEQLALVIHYFTTLSEDNWEDEFCGQESTLSLPFLEEDPKFENWTGVLVENEYSKKIRQFAKDNNHNVEINTGVCHFVTCLIEAYH